MTRTNTLRAAIFLTALATASAAVAQLTPPNGTKEMAPVAKDTSAAVKVNGATIPAYRLDAAIKARVSVEAAVAQTWHKFVGDDGECVSIEHFGASADYKTLFQQFGFTTEHVVEAGRRSLARANEASA